MTPAAIEHQTDLYNLMWLCCGQRSNRRGPEVDKAVSVPEVTRKPTCFPTHYKQLPAQPVSSPVPVTPEVVPPAAEVLFAYIKRPYLTVI